MQTSPYPPGDAALARDAAAARLRRLTVGAFAGASALAVTFAGVAAATTHQARKAVAKTVTATTLPAVHVSAPSATPPGGASATAAPAAPLQAPAPAYYAAGRHVRRLVSAEATSSSFPALGTTATVAVTEPETLAQARRCSQRELEAIDLACSRFRSDSELVRAERGVPGREVEVSELLLEAVRVALRAAEASGGLVDPTVGNTMRLAGYDRPLTVVRARDGRLFRPSFEPAAGWRTIELDESRRTVRAPSGVELDLGATAKALAADRAAHAAVGGDRSRCAREPRRRHRGRRRAAAAAAGRSGSRTTMQRRSTLRARPSPCIRAGSRAPARRVRRWATAGGELHHIVDPRTGRPTNSPWRTVTVAAASCVDANTASTAALVLGDDAPAWLDERRLPSRLVRLDGSVACVGAWPAEAA